jgi:ribose transport system permease protein
VISAVTAIIEPRFLTPSNIENVARQLSVPLVLGIAAALPIIAGGIDLSIAAIAAGSGVILGLVWPTYGLPAAIGASLAFGLFVGMLSGSIIARFNASPFIVTLGAAVAIRGAALIWTDGRPIYDFPPEITEPLGYGTTLGVPIPTLLALAGLLLVAAMLRWTVFGRFVYAIGGNERAAYLSGVPVARQKIMTYMASGLAAAVAGIVLVGRTGAAQATAATGLELQAIGAIIIGGVALTGGYGGARQIFYGVLLLGVLSNAMNLAGVSSYLQQILLGTVVIVAAVVDKFRRRER